MGENYGINLSWVDWQWIPVLETKLFETLKHSAVDHDPGRSAGQKKPAAGNGARST